MLLEVENSVFLKKDFNPKTAELLAPGCPGLAVQQMVVYSLPLSSKCGTKISENGTHIIYENELTGMYQMFLHMIL
jgi:hypothetical protein